MPALSSVIFLMQVLEEEKIHHMMSIGEYPLYIIPIDEDLLSFELDLAYKVRWMLLHLHIFFKTLVSIFVLYFLG